jgi:hypothetical protein
MVCSLTQQVIAMAVVLWQFNLYLFMFLVPISWKFSSRPWNSAFSDNVCHLFVTDRGFPPNIRVSFTNKIEYHDVIEILLKMAFNYTINLLTQHPRCKHVSTQHYMLNTMDRKQNNSSENMLTITPQRQRVEEKQIYNLFN